MNKGSLHVWTPISRELTPVPTSSAQAHGTPGAQLEANLGSDPSRGKSEIATPERRDEDTVGYKLCLAAQSIAAARQDALNESASARKKYETLKEQYEQLSRFYATIYQQYQGLRETAEIRLQHANGELSALKIRNNAELRARYDTIRILQNTIDSKNAKITSLEGELEQREKHAAEAIRGHEDSSSIVVNSGGEPRKERRRK